MGISQNSVIGGIAIFAGVLMLLRLARFTRRYNITQIFVLAIPSVLCILFGTALILR